MKVRKQEISKILNSLGITNENEKVIILDAKAIIICYYGY